MNNVIAFNRMNPTTTDIYSANDLITVYADGALEYTQNGVFQLGPKFRSHNIDIRKIQTLEEHEFAIKTCSSSAAKISGDNSVFDDLDAHLLRALMASADEAEVEILQRQIEIRNKLCLAS